MENKDEKFRIKQAEFVTSVAKSSDLKNDLPEIAFAGKSNCGKSSLINMLTNQKKLAVTSSTPGRTRLINYFLINNEFYFIDLPGYGFASSGKETQKKFSELIEDYLKNANNLKLLLLLIDIRNGANENDKQMLLFCNYYRIPFVVVATKADKIKKSELASKLQRLTAETGLGKDNIIITSSEKRLGKEKILKEIEKLVK